MNINLPKNVIQRKDNLWDLPIYQKSGHAYFILASSPYDVSLQRRNLYTLTSTSYTRKEAEYAIYSNVLDKANREKKGK